MPQAVYFDRERLYKPNQRLLRNEAFWGIKTSKS